MGYIEIYDEYQSKYEISNRIKFKEFLKVFKEETGLNIERLMTVYQVDSSDPAQVFCFLKWVLFTYNKKYVPYFYELLESFEYDMFSEIIDTVKLIGRDTNMSVDPNVVNYALIKSIY